MTQQPSVEQLPSRVGAGIVFGVDAISITVEAILHSDSKNGVRLLGSVDRVVREAFHRVLDAFRAVDLPSPRGTPTINFAPAAIPKTGCGFDLPLAIALAGASGILALPQTDGLVAHGEIGLDGRILPVRGVVPVAIAARDRGWHTLLAHPRDAELAAAVPGIVAIPVRRLDEAIDFVRGKLTIAPSPLATARDLLGRAPGVADYADIKGHETPKLAMATAAAGAHNVLFVGPPGSGKSALIRRLPGLLSAPDETECLDILRVRSAGDLVSGSLLAGRPFRAPHHSSSTASLLGGGSEPRPGEVTLAHHGILFLDELPEFRREALEGLRQPVEELSITIGRASRTATMPADFVLVAAMNPCPCGFAGDARRGCRCSPRDRHSYQNRISGPLLDRFDLVVAVPALDPAEFERPVEPDWTTGRLRERVAKARDRARSRSASGGRPNGRLEGEVLEGIVALDATSRTALDRVARLHRLSGRGRTRILRLARTLADLADRDEVRAADLLEAARLRAEVSSSAERW